MNTVSNNFILIFTHLDMLDLECNVEVRINNYLGIFESKLNLKITKYDVFGKKKQ